MFDYEPFTLRSVKMFTAVVILFACLVVSVAWWLLKDLVLGSPLDNIPGPPSPSLLAGHLPKFFHRHEGWKIHTELSDNYAAVSKINGPFGVYLIIPLLCRRVTLLTQLYRNVCSMCSIRQHFRVSSLKTSSITRRLRSPSRELSYESYFFFVNFDLLFVIRLNLLVLGPGLVSTLRASPSHLLPFFCGFH